MELEEFLSMFLQTDKAGLRGTAENLVKQEMVLNAIIEAEGIKATDEEKDKLAQMNYFADAEEMVPTYGEESCQPSVPDGSRVLLSDRQCRTGKRLPGQGRLWKAIQNPRQQRRRLLRKWMRIPYEKKSLIF